MDTKKRIRKIIVTLVIAVAGVSTLIVLVAAISDKKKGQCADYKVTIKSEKKDLFLNDREVLNLLATAAGGPVKGREVAAINTQKIEETLEKNAWISDAQLYFDNKNVLHVSITEREPIARLFTTTGSSFYIDSNMKRMPLSEKVSIRVPVFTGFPEGRKLSPKDSLLLADVKKIALYINDNKFWAAQTAGIDITEDRKFELTPVVGNHTIRMGDAADFDKKFNRMFLFYKSVLSKTGFDTYKVIDAQYNGQVIAMRNTDKNSRASKEQVRQNIQRLMKQSLEVQNDTLVTAQNVVVNPVLQQDEDRPALQQPVTEMKESVTKPQKSSAKVTGGKKNEVKKDNSKKPKALMPKKQ